MRKMKKFHELCKISKKDLDSQELLKLKTQLQTQHYHTSTNHRFKNCRVDKGQCELPPHSPTNDKYKKLPFILGLDKLYISSPLVIPNMNSKFSNFIMGGK